MGNIKKILENELIGGTKSTDIYPVTSIKAVYDENSERLDHILNRRGVVNISTNYNDDHIAEELTLAQAIAKVPSADRVLGFQGKYLAPDGWHTIIYTGDNLINWDDETKWIDLADKIFNSISNNATFAGIATPATNPGTPDGPIFYFAIKVGTYSNFDGVVLNNPGLIVLHNLTGTWNSMKVYECLQEFGNSTSSPMSQKATTDAIQAEIERAMAAEHANATSIIGTSRIADGAVTTEKLSDSVKNIGLNYITISTLNAMTPVGLAPSCLANNPTQPLRSIVVNNDIVIGYVDTYSDEFGFIVLQTFNTRANIDADGNIISYDNNIIHTYTRSSGVSDDTWINKWSETNIDLSSYVSKEELAENNTSLLATIDAKIKTAINDVFTKIPLNEINDESYFSGTASGKNRFIVIDGNFVIGYIDVIVDKETTYNTTQIFTTTLLLNEGTFINGSNNTLHVYLRNYDLRTSEWSNWKEQFTGSGSSEIADGSIDETKLSTSVNEALLKKFEFSELHTAPKGKCIVTNGGKVVGYADTVTSGDADKITQIMCTTMVQSDDDLNTFVGGDGTSMKTYKRYYSIQYSEWGDWEEIQIGGGGTTISDPITSTEIDNICN